MAIQFVRTAATGGQKGSSVTYRNPGDVDHTFQKRAEFTKASSTGISYIRSGVRQANRLARLGKKGSIVPADVVVNITVTAPAGLNAGEKSYVKEMIQATVAQHLAAYNADASLLDGFVSDTGTLSIEMKSLEGYGGTTAKQFDHALINAVK